MLYTVIKYLSRIPMSQTVESMLPKLSSNFTIGPSDVKNHRMYISECSSYLHNSTSFFVPREEKYPLFSNPILISFHSIQESSLQNIFLVLWKYF